MRRSIRTLLIGLLLLASTAGTAAGFFSDVTSHWAVSLVSALEAKGIVNGDGQGRFGPDAPLTRAEMAKLIVGAAGLEQNAKTLAAYPSRYADVPSAHWAVGFIEALAEMGVAEGYPDGRFGPEESVTRAQLAMMLIRATDLAERARLSNYEQTRFKDDADIPAWARGAVVVAQAAGLMQGFDDGFFYPAAAVTRAEGSAAVFRLISDRGALFQLSGTLVQFDPRRGTGVVRDEFGHERAFDMARSGRYMRGGSEVPPEMIRLLDQVWVIVDDAGNGRFLDARYRDLEADGVAVRNGRLAVIRADGVAELDVQPGALIYLNGQPADLSRVDGRGPAYLALDELTGAVRVLDVVDAPIAGQFMEADGSLVRLIVEDDVVEYQVAPGARVFLNGRKADLAEFDGTEEVQVALDQDGRITYLQAVR